MPSLMTMLLVPMRNSMMTYTPRFLEMTPRREPWYTSSLVWGFSISEMGSFEDISRLPL